MAERTDAERAWLSNPYEDRLSLYQTYAYGALVDPAGMQPDQIAALAYGLFKDPEVDRAAILPDFNGDISSFASLIPDHPGMVVTATITSVSGGISTRALDTALYVGALTLGGAAAGKALGLGAALKPLWGATVQGGRWVARLGGKIADQMPLVRRFPKLTAAVAAGGLGVTAGSAFNEAKIGAEGRTAADQAAIDTNPMTSGLGGASSPIEVTGGTVTVAPEDTTTPTTGPTPTAGSGGGSLTGSTVGSGGSLWGSAGGSVLSDTPPPLPADEDFYGVPPGFRPNRIVNRAEPVTNSLVGKSMFGDAVVAPRGFEDTIIQSVEPTFGGDDANQALNQLYTSNQLEAFQSMMEQAGLLDEGRYLPGVIDGATVNAMIGVMGAANNMGVDDWRVAAQQVLQSGLENLEKTRDELAPLFVRRTYERPDYATLSQGVKSLFRDRLGRDPLDYEVALFADQLQRDYRSEFDVQEDARYQEFVAGNKDWNIDDWDVGKSMFGDVGPIAPDGFTDVPDDPRFTVNREGVRTAGGGTVQGIDPAARFAENFESKFAQTIDNADAKQVNTRAQQRAMGLLSSVRNRMRSL